MLECMVVILFVHNIYIYIYLSIFIYILVRESIQMLFGLTVFKDDN